MRLWTEGLGRPKPIADWVEELVRRDPTVSHAEINGCVVAIQPDTGCTHTTMTKDTLEYISGNCTHKPRQYQVRPYGVELANGHIVRSNKRITVDITLMMGQGRAQLPGVDINVLPGERGVVLLGQQDLGAAPLNITPIHQQLHDRVGHLMKGPQAKKAKLDMITAAEATKDWTQRRAARVKDEPDYLAVLDDYVGCGAPPPTKAAVKAALYDAIKRATKAGASRFFTTELEKLLFGKYPDIWRLQLGADPPMRVKPLVLRFKEEGWPARGIRARRYSSEQKAFLQETIPNFLRLGILEPSTSRFAAPPFCPYKPDGSLRFCVDSRLQNKHTVTETWPIPHIQDIMDRLVGAQVFAKFDMVSGYFQCPTATGSRKYQAIVTEEGNWQFTRLIMGQKNSVGQFQRVMTEIMSGEVHPVNPDHYDSEGVRLKSAPPLPTAPRKNLLRHGGLIIYIDDHLLLNKLKGQREKEERLLQQIDEYLGRLQSHNGKLKPTKCEFYKEDVVFLGHHCSKAGIAVDPEKKKALTAMPVPQTAGELMQFLCSLNFLRGSIPFYNAIMSPLQDILNLALKGTRSRSKKQASTVKLQKVGWNKTHEQAYARAKNALHRSICLAYPDPEKTYVLWTDASDKHFGAILTQTTEEELKKPLQDQQHEPIGLNSGTFRNAQVRWAINCKEAYSIMNSCNSKQFRHHLMRSKPFVLVTDHHNLRYIFDPSLAQINTSKATMDRLARWAWDLSGFNYIVRHTTDEVMWGKFADMLSRWGAGITHLADIREKLCKTPATVTHVALMVYKAGGLVAMTCVDKRANTYWFPSGPVSPTDRSVAHAATRIINMRGLKLDPTQLVSMGTWTPDPTSTDLLCYFKTRITQKEARDLLVSRPRSEGAQKTLWVSASTILRALRAPGKCTLSLSCNEVGPAMLATLEKLTRKEKSESAHLCVLVNKLQTALSLKTRGREAVVTTRKEILSSIPVKYAATIYDVPKPWEFPAVEELRQAQQEDSERPKGLKKDSQGLFRYNGRIYVPDARQLRSRLCIVAHAGAAGHRSIEMTRKILGERFTWKGMAEFVTDFCHHCLQCVKSSTGKLLNRPMGTALYSDTPGEMLWMDYIYMQQESNTGDTYILVLLDSCSHMVELVPTKHADAVTAARAVMMWAARWGMPAYVCSDQGSHFKNSLMAQLAKVSRIKHIGSPLRIAHGATQWKDTTECF